MSRAQAPGLRPRGSAGGPTPGPEARHQLGEAGAYVTEELAVQSARQAYLEAPLVRAR